MVASHQCITHPLSSLDPDLHLSTDLDMAHACTTLSLEEAQELPLKMYMHPPS